MYCKCAQCIAAIILSILTHSIGGVDLVVYNGSSPSGECKHREQAHSVHP